MSVSLSDGGGLDDATNDCEPLLVVALDCEPQLGAVGILDPKVCAFPLASKHPPGENEAYHSVLSVPTELSVALKGPLDAQFCFNAQEAVVTAVKAQSLPALSPEKVYSKVETPPSIKLIQLGQKEKVRLPLLCSKKSTPEKARTSPSSITGPGAALAASASPSISSSPSSSRAAASSTAASETLDLKSDTPAFYVENGNGWKLVSASLEGLGWTRIPFEASTRPTFDLLWTPVRHRNGTDYRHVALSDNQLVNHVQNNGHLTTKLGLLRTLRAHFGENMPTWFPESFRLDDVNDAGRLLARNAQIARNEGQEPVWILKPSGTNCGKGITLVHGAKDLAAECREVRPSVPNPKKSANKAISQNNVHLTLAVAQRYVLSPLLLKGRKFDLRVYGLVARTDPGRFLFLYHSGYARLSVVPYSTDDFSDRFCHLTNASVQKKHADYSSKMMESIWDMKMLEEELVSREVAPVGWATDPAGGLQTQTKHILAALGQAAQQKLERRRGFFDLFGIDLLVDESLNCSLLEVNVNPALSRDNHVLEALLPRVVDGALRTVLKANGRPSGATAVQGFEPLVDEEASFVWTPQVGGSFST